MTILIAIGIATGCVYSLVALGYSMLFRTTGIVNFAQGSFVMVGGMSAYGFFSVLHLQYAVAVLVATAVTALTGLVLWVLVILPLWHRRSATYVVILATFVFSVLAGNVILAILGGSPEALPPWISGFTVKIGGAGVSGQYVIVIGFTLVVMAATGAVLQWTTLGRSLRACASSRETSKLLGISPQRIGALAMASTAALAGLAGIMITPAQFTSSGDALSYGVYGFVSAVLGGFGSLRGALAGGILVGVLQALVGFYVSSTFEDVIVYSLLFVLIVLRPTGIFGVMWADTADAA